MQISNSIAGNFGANQQSRHTLPRMTPTVHRRSMGAPLATPGYLTSQIIRKRIEECFGWAKTIGGLRKSWFIGREELDFQFVLTFAACNLIRMRNLKVVSC